VSNFRGRKTGVGYIKNYKEVGSTFPPIFPSERNNKSSSLLKLIAVKGNCIHKNFSSISSFIKILYHTSLLLHPSEKMTRGFITRDPINTMRIHQHPPMLEIFTRHNWRGYFDKLRVYNDEVAKDFSLSLIPLTKTHAHVMVRGLSIHLTSELIRKITTLTLGVPWRKEDNGNSQTTKKKFFLEG